MREISQNFITHDAGSTGVMSRSEFDKLLKNLGISEEDRSKASSAIDACTTSDGNVDYNKFVSWMFDE